MRRMNQEIEKRVAEFAAEIAALANKAALEAVQQALGAPTPVAKKSRKSKAPRAGRNGRRSPEDLAKLAATIEAHVKANPGQRIETIATALDMPTRVLTRPVQKLLVSKAIRKRGERRATKYYPGGGRGAGGKKRAKG